MSGRSYSSVLRAIRWGLWRRTGTRSDDGRYLSYDIGLTRRDIAVDSGVDGHYLDAILDRLIASGMIVYRKSQRRYIAAGKITNQPR